MRVNKKEHIKTAVISIVVAVLVWMAINYINPPELTTTIYNLPVRISGEGHLEDIGLTVVDKSEISGLSVSIKGKRNDLLKLSGGVYVDIDVSSIEDAGEHQLTGNVTLPSSRLSIDKVRFTSIPIKVEQIDEKEIKIRVKQTGSISGKLVRCENEDETVTISGARSEIAEVKYGETTIDISQFSDDTEIEASYVLMNKNDEPVSRNETIEASKSKVNVDCTFYDTRNVPIRLIMSPDIEGSENIDLSKSTVTPAAIEIGIKPHSEVDCVYVNVDEIKDEMECTITEPVGAYIPEDRKTVKVKLASLKKNSKEAEEKE